MFHCSDHIQEAGGQDSSESLRWSSHIGKNFISNIFVINIYKLDLRYNYVKLQVLSSSVVGQ